MTTLLLTQRFIESVPTPAKGEGRAVYRDKLLPGFELRVSEDGTRRLSLRFHDPLAGKRRRLSWAWPHYTLKQARQEAEAALRAREHGEEVTTKKQAAIAAPRPETVAQLCERYVESHLKKRVRRWQAAQGEIEKHIKPHLGELRLDQIVRGHVREMLGAIEPKYPVAANRALQRLRAVFNWALENDFAERNPTLGVKKPTLERPVSRVLSDAELAAVWRACDGLGYPARQFVRFLILSGQRRDDLRLMHWKEIDLPRRDWVVPGERYKGKRAHLVPLTDAMVEMLEEMPWRDHGGFVFSPSGGVKAYGNLVKPKRAIDKAMRAAARAAAEDAGGDPEAVESVLPWTLHDLRRTLRTGLSRLGVRPDIAERVIGHSVGGRLGITYDAYEYRPEKLAALEAWGKHVAALVAGHEQPSNVTPPRAAAAE